MAIKGKQFVAPRKCPKCGEFRRLGFEGKAGKRPAVMGLYAKLVDGGHAQTLGSGGNKVGWICRNCGEYKIEIEVKDDIL